MARTSTQSRATVIMARIFQKTCTFSIVTGWTARTCRMEVDRADAAAIRQFEEQLLESAIRTSAGAVAGLLADDFVEFGSSGRVFNKEQIVHSLQQEAETCRRSLQDFETKLLAPGVILATYRVSRQIHNGEPPVRLCGARSGN